MPLAKHSPRSKIAAARLLAAAFSLLSFVARPATAAPDLAVKSTVLFCSWEDIFRGRLEPTIDRAQVSPEGRKVIEGLQISWNRKFATNGLGMKMYHAPRNIHIIAEKARKIPMPLKADRPWEASLDDLTITILQEDGKLRCWYGVILPHQSREVVFQQERGVEVSGSASCYAESTDGFTWTKPNLGVLAFNGSKDNNIVSYQTIYGSVFHDRQGAPDEQYKSVQFGKLPPQELARTKAGDFNSYCLFPMVSPDGYHWRTLTNETVVRHFCDTENIVAWDPMLKKYVGFFRDHQGGRAISRAETDNFHSWPPPQPILVPSAEEPPDAEYYNNCYTTYPGEPSLRLLFPSIFHDVTDRVDVRLAVSREGRAYSWVSHEPVIELGKPEAGDGGQIYASPNLIRLGDGRLALPFQASPRTHNEGFASSFYTNFPMNFSSGWAVWDDGRLAGIETDTDGEFYTPSVRPEGDRLEINARTAPGGSIKVEMCEDGLPVAGYTLADNRVFAGDSIWAPVQWQNKTGITNFIGKKVQIRFLLTKAKIFGYRIATDQKPLAARVK